MAHVPVIHWGQGGDRLSGIAKEPAFMLSNGRGSFAYFSHGSHGSHASSSAAVSSKFEGFFVAGKEKDDPVLKVIESLSLLSPPASEVSEMANHLTWYERTRGVRKERLFLPQDYNSFCYELSEASDLAVVLDCRRLFDLRQFGRYYRIYQKESLTIVEFIKRTDANEDATHTVEEFRLYAAIRSEGSIIPCERWLERTYALDAKRGSASQRYVYHAVDVQKCKRLVISVAFTEQKACEEAQYVFTHFAQLLPKPLLLDPYERLEVVVASNALTGLLTSRGLYAGIPWFCQYWSRDTLISLPALPPLVAKRMLFGFLRKLQSDGRLPALADGSGNSSSDAPGWLFLRAKQLLHLCSEAERKELAQALEHSLGAQEELYQTDGLFFSAKNETWMDTSWNDTGREGFPLEVQALTLAAYELLGDLTGSLDAKKKAQRLAQEVRGRFWNNCLLADTAGDYTVRPNLFIAAYAYPKLLSAKEWESCIDYVLPRLWLPWGGLSTLDQTHPLFQKEYTGEDNRSYHRGDSWFWINNLAALVMHTVNKEKYKAYIQKIEEASLKDLLWTGMVGGCSELSSAKEQRAEGCLNQAWSCSTLIELLKRR